MEPDYLPDLEVFIFQPCLYPMKSLHPGRLYTPPHKGVQGGISPPTGSGGKRAPNGGSGVKPSKEKLPCKRIL